MSSRRSFLKAAALGACGVCCVSVLPASAKGANDRIRVGVLGVGGRGNDHCKEFSKLENVELAAIADPHKDRMSAAKTRWEKETGREIQAFQDPRRILEDASIDAVSVATCNHWHALLTLWGAEAGKHVYVEKPCSHTLFEGRQLVNAARKYGVCIQHGTQRRSDDVWRRAAAAFQSGKYGKPVAVFAHANRTRNGVGFKPIQDPPTALDWNLWLGPADYAPYHENLFNYNWHWFWNTGDGEIGNNGVHFFDICRLGLSDPHVQPKRIFSFGTRIVNAPNDDWRDQAETPRLQAALYEMDGIPCYFESCNFRDKNSNWQPIENSFFHTTDGFFDGSKDFVTNDGTRVPIDVEFTPAEPGGPFGNFINSVRANTPEKLNAPIEEGHYSASFCHLANISYRTGRDASLDECLAALGTQPILQKRLDATLENMQNAIPGRDLHKDVRFTLGQTLEVDSTSERFTNCEAANALLSKPGRGEFVVRAY